MKKSYIAIIVLILIVLGAWFAFGKGKKAEAPTSPSTTNEETSSTDGTEEVGMEETPLQNGNTMGATVNAGASITQETVKEFTVSGQNFSFTPSVINVNKGDKVKITFKNSSGMHNFTIDEFGVASKTTKSSTEEVLEFTANKAGSFQYYCGVGTHRAMGMVGTLNVK